MIQNYTYANPLNNNLSEVVWWTPSVSTTIPTYQCQYSYDLTGNLTQDPRNNVSSINYISYNDMPQSITNISGTKTYRYDATGKRTMKQGDPNDIDYYLDGVILGAQGNVKSYQTADGYARPFYNDGLTIVVEHFFNIKDWLGTNRGVIDQTGAVLNANDNYPFGLRLPGRAFTSSNAEGERYQFTGHEYDGETNYDYHGARYYNRELGRYMSVDPLANQFFSWSTYNYTMNNPINMIDPDGRGPTTTYVDKYGKVLDVTNDGKTDIVQFDDIDEKTWDGKTSDLVNKDNGVVVGKTLFWHDFMNTKDYTTDEFTFPARGAMALNNGVSIPGSGDATEYDGNQLFDASTKMYSDMVAGYGATVSLALLAKHSRNGKIFDIKSSLGYDRYQGVKYKTDEGNVYTSLRVLGNIIFGANMEIARNQNLFPQDKMEFYKTAMVAVGGYNMHRNNIDGEYNYPYYGEHKLSGRAIWYGYFGGKYPNK